MTMDKLSSPHDQNSMRRLSRRKFLKLAGSGIGLTVAGGVLAACGPAAPAAPTAVPAKPTGAPAPTTVPKASGKISVYSALNETTNNAFVVAFKKAVSGIDVEVRSEEHTSELQSP